MKLMQGFTIKGRQFEGATVADGEVAFAGGSGCAVGVEGPMDSTSELKISSSRVTGASAAGV